MVDNSKVGKAGEREVKLHVMEREHLRIQPRFEPRTF